MHILNYNDFAASLFKCDEWDGGGFDYYGSRAAIPKYATTTDNQTTLSEGFNTHSVTMPNGCVVELHENGEVYKTEADGTRNKVRFNDDLLNKLIK